ncbi:FecR family protein [Pararcticibacter amylolyticus]|uniref:Anti-sigma factor n=1 Tax=Pararcticibacter amylolyticus TaxID=2173175 RepID=A0A2U2PGU4_9SPHI|nr:FecR family protein [Pararcticibacter amylolyticus]PWG80626.1 anti-sigma factor [Pararcticibacter amylolyticus]
MEQETRFELLLNKYLANQCSAEEADELFNYIGQDKSTRLLVREMAAEFRKALDIPHELPDDVSRRVSERLKKEISGPEIRIDRKSRLIKWRVAASIAFLLLSGSLYLIYHTKTNPGQSEVSVTRTNDIRPGGNRAILTLANGSKINLSDRQNGTIASQGSLSILKSARGRIIYQLQETPGNGAGSIHGYNTIETPKGGQYQVVLPDGSSVWLNAASSLRYPAAFTGDKRVVELDGEAYFEVSARGRKEGAAKIPFIVKSKGQEIEVLGTHFNVSAYKDEERTSTTLLEGAVRVKNEKNSVVIKPGQKVIFNWNNNRLDVKSADTEEAIAWKNGYFMFTNENIESVMQKIARWYDVEIEYRSDVSGKKLWGSISRFENVSQVLKMLEMTKIVHFKIEGRRVIVMT